MPNIVQMLSPFLIHHYTTLFCILFAILVTRDLIIALKNYMDKYYTRYSV